MSKLQELTDESLGDFLSAAPLVLVTFSAHWCGPCRASKPRLQKIATTSKIPMGIVYEDDLGEGIHYFNIKAFPTYVLYRDGQEVDRVEGADLEAVVALLANIQLEEPDAVELDHCSALSICATWYGSDLSKILSFGLDRT
eukprot:CAMPEP_0194056870 /NCGR_PEP_ID=MMETSP0009_2-20130614/61563_1 /TAXON_ID=210454 /ORGANISM="Grammatophora oceanica, Strain CCMP 410" /LENGTH=140 /DNA_ID=CAMNT_0038706401 /DNA_START=19 /DNA_END=442 /DNA_ORIENTATION=-